MPRLGNKIEISLTMEIYEGLAGLRLRFFSLCGIEPDKGLRWSKI
jgi:hypothetical protein